MRARRLTVLPMAAALLAAAARVTTAQGEDERPVVVVDAFDFAASLESRVVPRVMPSNFEPPFRTPLRGVGRGAGARFPTTFSRHLRHDAASTAPTSAPRREGDADATAAAPDEYAAVGTGVADLLVAELLALGRLRILDRQLQPAVPDAERLEPRFRVAGAITRFGTEDQSITGGGGMRRGLGLLGIRRRLTTVVLVARVVNPRTGEVVASVRGEGSSRKGSGATVGGLGGGAGGLVNVGSREFRSSALGEATEQAVRALARELTNAVVALPRP